MSKPKVLIVEDEVDILNLLRYNFEAAGYPVCTAKDGLKVFEIAKKQQPDVILLDIMLPGRDGFEVCKELKSDTILKNVPVIMLTAKGEEVDRIVGLELGADDYVVKPFSPRELLLRVKAILRRSPQDENLESFWEYQGLKVDFASHKVMINENQVNLTATEFNLLAELIQSKGKVKTRDQLLNNVWGYEFDGYARTVDTHVRRLRQKIEPYSDLVETVRGVGYRLKEQK